jgi:hypothetical protein
MSESDFIRYVGNEDIHDGTIKRVTHVNDTVQVVVRGKSTGAWEVVFHQVQSIDQHRAEGMLLYAIAEMRANDPFRRYSFASWDEDDDARLDVVARSWNISEVADG